MSFLYPVFLWALAAIAIPIIIHLFFFRRFKKVYFSNVQFLKEVKKETASRSRLKHLLVLLSRILTVIFLVLAFAQPFIPKNESEVVKGAKAVSVFIDNSFSMKAQSNDVSLLEKAKAKAREIADAFSPEDQLQIITNDFEGRHQRLVDKEEFLGYVDEIQLTPNVQELSKVLERQKQVLEGSDSEQKNVFIVSDFQKNIVDLENDTTYQFYFIPLQSLEQQNVFVDSLWFNAPVQTLNQTNQLMVRLTNTGDKTVENSRMTLKINDEIKALKDFNIEAGANVIDTINFTISEAGWHRAQLNITDYPIDFDDNYYFTFKVEKNVEVLSINQNSESKFINTLFKKDDYFKLVNQSVNQLDYSAIKNYRLIILNNLTDISSGLASELKQYLENGGDVVIFTPNNAKSSGYNSFLKSVNANSLTQLNESEREVTFMNVKQEVFKDVFEKIPNNLDLPRTKKSWELSRFSNTNEEMLLRFKDGGSMMSKYSVRQGKLYVSAVGLNTGESNLPSHAIFVPMLYKMAFAGGDLQDLAYTIGTNNLIGTKTSVENAESILKLKSDEKEFIPGQKTIGSTLLLTLNDQLKEAGIYQLFENEENPLAYFGFNFNRKESILDYLAISELKNRFVGKNVHFIDNPNADITQEVGEIDKGVVLWKICLMLALGFLLIEILLLRFWRT